MAKRKRLPGNQAQEVVVESPQVRPVASDLPEAEEVARLAHQYWLERGSPIGTPEEDWFRAEEEFRLRRQQLEQEGPAVVSQDAAIGSKADGTRR